MKMLVKFMVDAKNIGIDVEMPKASCNDKKCPFHGNVGIRGRQFKGKVVKITFQKNALVEWARSKALPKYERREKRRTRVWAHNPLCLGIKVNDTVRIAETRKLSKTKNFVIIQKV